MPKVFLLLLLCILGRVPVSEAQQRICSTMDFHRSQMEQDPGYRERVEALQKQSRLADFASASTQTVIPVVVHVLWNDPVSNLSDEQIKSQIDVLNEDYGATNSNIADVPAVWQNLVRDSKIRFCLARTAPNGTPTSGIIRKQTSVDAYTQNDPRLYSDALGGSAAWPRTDYLNIWVCRLSDNQLGYAAFPGTAADKDGVVISYKAFGRIGGETKKPYNLGRTATHEVGHWLNLLHIWGDDGGDCSNDDYVSDTPEQGNSNTRCLNFPATDACSPVPPGIMFMNYMDYSDDKCMSFFTADQTLRMDTVLSTSRSSLRNSSGSMYLQRNGMEATIDSVLSPVTRATQQCFRPELKILNYGTDTIFKLDFSYRLNEGLVKTFTWRDVLPPMSSTLVRLGEISSPPDDRILEIRMLLDDSVKSDNYVSISLRTDAYAQQNCRQNQPWVYPNPVGESQLACLKTNYPQTRMITVCVYDAQARIVFKRELQINAGDALPIDLRSFQSGFYIAELRSDQSVDTVKFIYHSGTGTSGYNYSCN